MSSQANHLTDVFRQLPFLEKLQLLELFFRNVREEAVKKESEIDERRQAAELLLPDYLSDKELTAFCVLDGEEIYETN